MVGCISDGGVTPALYDDERDKRLNPNRVYFLQSITEAIEQRKYESMMPMSTLVGGNKGKILRSSQSNLEIITSP